MKNPGACPSLPMPMLGVIMLRYVRRYDSVMDILKESYESVTEIEPT